MPKNKAELLIEASKEIEDTKPQVLVDGGVENYNSAVDKLVESGLRKRILAQTKIRYSNSFVESWWRVLARKSPTGCGKQQGRFPQWGVDCEPAPCRNPRAEHKGDCQVCWGVKNPPERRLPGGPVGFRGDPIKKRGWFRSRLI